ncbi:MucBP domain-containing protein, partial [Enterococcus faecalis]
LADSEILKGKYGLPYETKAKEIKGWKVKQLPENAQGIYSDQAQEVVYVYVPIKNMGFELQKPISTVEKNKVGKYQKYPQTGEKITNKFFEIGLSLVMASVAILVLKYKKDI